MRALRQPSALRCQGVAPWSRPASQVALRQTLRNKLTRTPASIRASSALMSERTWFHTLEDGLRLEVISAEVPSSSKPPLVFIHGIGHGAWCWQVHFLPFFQSKGYDCHAISLRAQAGSDRPEGAEVGGTMREHADDVSHFIKTVLKRPAVVVGHSFGGLVSQLYVGRDYETREKLAGMVVFASGPPQGTGGMMKRFFLRTPLKAISLSWVLMRKAHKKDPAAAKKLLFSDDLSDELVNRYFGLLREHESPIPVVDQNERKKDWPLPAPPPDAPPVLVVGGDHDGMIDVEALEETGEHYGTKPLVFKDTAHDIMLDTRWEDAAVALEGWFSTLPSN